MAVNETIVTGRKFRKCIDATSKAWQRISFWTKSSDVEFEDGKNAETKLGAIDGITDSLEDTSSRMAASAKAVSTLNNNLGSKANGAFVVLTGTTHTAAGQQTSQNYPSGFNQNNCAVAGVMVKLGQNWYFGNYSSGYTYINAQVILSSQVGIIPASGWTNCPYKIVLYKYL